MQETNNQGAGQLPIPAVDGWKKEIADLSSKLADDAVRVSVLVKRLEKEDFSANSSQEAKEAISREKSSAIEMFYETAERIMTRIEPHLAHEDVTPFSEYFHRLQTDTLNAYMYELEAIHGLNSFLQKALKNSNLLELGTKSMQKPLHQTWVKHGI